MKKDEDIYTAVCLLHGHNYSQLPAYNADQSPQQILFCSKCGDMLTLERSK